MNILVKMYIIIFLFVSFSIGAEEIVADSEVLLIKKHDASIDIEIELLETKIKQEKDQLNKIQDKSKIAESSTTEEEKELRNSKSGRKKENSEVSSGHGTAYNTRFVPDYSYVHEVNKKFKVRLGLSVGLLEEFDVIESVVSEGRMYSSSTYTPYIELQTPYLFFSQKNTTGIYLDFAYRSFDFNRQEVGYKNFFDNDEDFDGVTLNLGTQVKGEMAHVSTVFFIKPRDRKDRNTTVLFGLGLGVSYLTAHGNTVITEGSSLFSVTPLTFDVSDTGIYLKILADLQWKHFFVTGLVQVADAESDGLEHFYVGLAINAGYSFEL
jgi:hypothetical protein